METENSDNKQIDKPWLFKKGQSGNPAGKPKGTFSLKTYAKKYLQEMTDDEKLEFMEGLPKEIIWKMAEGMPKQDTELKGKIEGNLIVEVSEKIADKYKLYDSNDSPSNDTK
jgi:hypothetical protein